MISECAERSVVKVPGGSVLVVERASAGSLVEEQIAHWSIALYSSRLRPWTGQDGAFLAVCDRQG